MNESPNFDNRRILVIDDNASIHEDYKKILCGNEEADADLNRMNAELFGVVGHSPFAPTFELDCALQGAAGLELVKEGLAQDRPYAMAFIDVKMPPGWDGVETTARIWQICPDIQVVICTAYSDYSWTEMVSRLGGSDRFVILKKPFENMEVLQLAYTATRKWNREQRARAKLGGFQLMATSDLRYATRQLQAEVERRNYSKNSELSQQTK